MNNEKFVKRWEKDKQKGKKKYLLTSGIMMGISVFVGYTIGRLAKGNFFDLFTEYYIYMHFAYLLGGFIGGVIGANLRWMWNEEKYNKLENNNLQE